MMNIFHRTIVLMNIIIFLLQASEILPDIVVSCTATKNQLVHFVSSQKPIREMPFG